MQTTHHMFRIEPLGIKVYTLEELTPGQNPPISLYQLGAKHASTLSFIHCGVQLWQLFPSFPKCWWEDVLTFSFVLPFPSLFLVQKLNIQHLQLPAV